MIHFEQDSNGLRNPAQCADELAHGLDALRHVNLLRQEVVGPIVPPGERSVAE